MERELRDAAWVGTRDEGPPRLVGAEALKAIEALSSRKPVSAGTVYAGGPRSFRARPERRDPAARPRHRKIRAPAALQARQSGRAVGNPFR